MKIIYTWLTLPGVLLFNLFSLVTAEGQTLQASAPKVVTAGDQFKLTYTVNTHNVSDFSLTGLPDDIDILMGPSTSKQSSFQMVNGHTSSSSTITYTYILSARKKGTFTIPAAHIKADGKAISSQPLAITVNAAAQGGQRQQSNTQRGRQPSMRQAGSAITHDDLFITVSANKRRVHEQEAVLLTYKVYTLVDLTQLEGKMPDLKGFHTQEVQLPQQKSFKVEEYNGRQYRTVTWSQYVMFPQITGKLTIPSITFNGIVVQQNRNVNPFEAFFNGGSGLVEVKKAIKAPSLTIQVDPLPEKPADFSGGVGRFKISAQMSKPEATTNDPVQLRVVVSGSGNMKLIKQPVVKWPKDFDIYDAKVTDKTHLTTNGVDGNMIYDFLAVPRHQGRYDIPPVEFTYYDTGSNSYKTLRTQSFNVDVAKGKGTTSISDYTGQEDVKLLNSDIRFIKGGGTHQHAISESFFASSLYWIILALMTLTFITILVVFRQRAIANANVVKTKAGKANKVARGRLRKASKLMFAGKTSEFFDEVLRALWGYVGDKVNLPVEKLSKENISRQLLEHGVKEENISPFLEAIDECEFERYAPGDQKGNMSKVFEKAMTAIERIDNDMRGRRKPSGAGNSAVIILLAVLLSPSLSLTAPAVTKAEADSAYTKGNYQQAIHDYEALLKQGVSAKLYYNLGNAYYRADNISRAIINYERALLLSPGDDDIRFNLQMARGMSIDKITPESEMFFITWYRTIVNMQSIDAWAVTAIAALALALILALLYIFGKAIWLRKTGFFGALILFVVFILSNIFAWNQRRQIVNRSGAVVTAPAATVKSTPAENGTDLFILHEGTRVTITDGTMSGWKEIRVGDGKKGWIEAKQIEVI